MGKATISEVAKEAGVSTATVSRVLNDKGPISNETRKKVNDAIKKLNYFPNLQAREVKIQKSHIIGLIVPSVDNLFFARVINGVEKYLKSNDYSCMLLLSRNSQKLEKECVQLLVSRNVSGIIVVDANTQNINEGFFDMMNKIVPISFINGDFRKENFMNVSSYEEDGAKQAMLHLIELGHKSICFIRGQYSFSYDVKEKVYDEIMNEYGLTSYKKMLHVGPGNNVDVIESTCDIVCDLLKKNIYTAFFCCNDLMAVGALEACHRLNIKVPEELSIVGFDNILLSRISTPKLTTVDQNCETLGIIGAELLIEKIENPEMYAKRVIVDTKLIVRDSTREYHGN